MSEQIRALDLRKDLDDLVVLFELCFADEMANRGGDFREQLASYRRLMPLLSLLGRFSNSFRHLLDGFVLEEDGRIVASVAAQKMGNDRTRWEIAMVATHPEYRRRGLARKLVSQAMAHARAHGAEVCILYVLAENVPAYELYRSLGFVHYDSKTELKLESLPQMEVQPARDYLLRPMEVQEWQARYDVTCRETPQAVQAFLPVSRAQYELSLFQRIVTPTLIRLQGIDSHLWAAEREGRVVAYMHVEAQRKPRIPHRLLLKIDPAHRGALAVPMLTMALEMLQDYPRENVLFATRTSGGDLLDLAHRYGFVEIETQHWLGARLEEARDQAHNPTAA